jgi:hypothetical protein
MQQLAHIDDFIAYQAGSHIIKLTWVNHGVYTVKVSNGVNILEDLGGAYPTENEARLIARGYAQMFKAEHEAKLAILENRDAKHDYSRTRVGCKPPTPAELDAIRHHTVNPDGTLTVTARPGQSWLLLRALHRRIGGQRIYKRGTRIITALTCRPEQLAAYLAEATERVVA